MNGSLQEISSPRLAGQTAAVNYHEGLKQEEETRRTQQELGLARFAQLPEDRKREAEARYAILAAMNAFIKAGGFKKNKGMHLFREQYEKKTVDLPEWVYETLKHDGKLGRATLYRWESARRERGLFGLASAYSGREGCTQLTEGQRDFVKALLTAHPDVLTPTIMAALQSRFIPQRINVPGSHVVRHFVKRYRRENESLLLFMKNPDAWRSKYQFAVGSASANITRLNQLWEADATPADVILSDGRHTIVADIDVFSRAGKLLVTPTSKAQAIGTLLRKSILDWGVPEIWRSDNGRDFTSLHIERVLDSLGIEQDFCPPFTPEAKPHVERFIHTFLHGIVELLPGFIGHNVAERKSIEARKSFAERFMKKGEAIEVQLTAREFQTICDTWIKASYMCKPHSGLAGKTPVEVARSWTEPVRRITDERALDVLLCPAATDGGWRTVGKKGVEANRRFYFNTVMAGYEGQRVQVKLDHADLGRAYIFEEKGGFLCMASCPDWTGINAQEEACYLKHAQKKLLVQQRSELKQLTREQRINVVPEQILSYRESLIENVKELPHKAEAYTTPAIEEAILAADQRDGVINKKALSGTLDLPPSVIAYEKSQEKVVSLRAKRNERRAFENDGEIYSWILDCFKTRTATEIQRQWRTKYEAWQDGGMKGRFNSGIPLQTLIGEVEASVEGL